MAKRRIAINGLGRIGRNVLKQIINHPTLELAAVNDLTDPATLAHLIKYDSIFGRYKGNISSTNKELIIDGLTIPVFAEKDPSLLPWKSLSIDCVIESTGRFTKAELAE